MDTKSLISAGELVEKLKNEFQIVNATGSIRCNIKDFEITVKQNSVVGNILEEWLANWLDSNNYDNIHHLKQAPPDFWLNPADTTKELLEVKCFQNSPGFDIANFQSYAKEIIEKPYRLDSNYLLIKYNMDSNTGLITIENIWLKKVWEICTTSGPRSIKVQEKKNIIYNIRPATWYSSHLEYPVFKSLEHFLSAIEQTLYEYSQTRATVAEKWSDKVKESYKRYFGVDLILPRWYDIKSQYNKG